MTIKDFLYSIVAVFSTFVGADLASAIGLEGVSDGNATIGSSLHLSVHGQRELLLAVESSSGQGVVAYAGSSRNIFVPHLEELQDALPSGWVMRLPSELPYLHAREASHTAYHVRIFQLSSPQNLTVSVFGCNTGQVECLIGSFSVEESDSALAQDEFYRRQRVGVPVMLAQQFEGYWVGASQRSGDSLSSLTWEQGGFIYTAQIPSNEQEYLVQIARSMMSSDPIYADSTEGETNVRGIENAAPVSPSLHQGGQVGRITNFVAESSQTLAQERPTQPNRDRFLQPLPTLRPIIPGERPVELIPPAPTPTPSFDDQQTFEIRQIEVMNSTILSTEEIDAIITPLEGRTVSFGELSQATSALTGLYLERGYITSRAIVEPQSIENGVVVIRVIEGGIEDIVINYTDESSQRLRQNYIRNRLALGIDTPLNVNDLEEQLRLLLADPLIENIEPILEAGTDEGQSILSVLVTEADPFEGDIGVDNYSPPSIGSVRFGANATYRNLTGIGDAIAASVYRTVSGGSTIVDLAYRAPVNPMNGTLQIGGQINRNEITESPLDAFDVEGESERIEVSFRQPIVRSLREELALSVGFSYQNGQTFVFDLPTPFGIGPDEDGISRTSVFRLGQDYVARDAQGAWSLRSLFNVGTGLFNATTNNDPIPDGQFFSWSGQAQRAQRLGDDHLLLLGLDLQFTPDSLLPSEQFVIGGGQSVRGYRQNARSGDNGIRFSLEDRITLERNEAGNPIFQLAPFVDLGAVWNQADNPNDLPNQRFLIGSGLGIIWQPLPRFNIRLDYGFPFIDLDDRGDNIQDDGLYFDIRYGF